MTKRNPQTKREDFSFGSHAWQEYYHGRNKDKKKAAPHKMKKPTKAQQRTADDVMNEHYQGEATKKAKRYAAILGPTGKTHAVKIARHDAQPYTFHDVDRFFEGKWDVVGAGTVPAKVRNPSPLGEDGRARGLVLLGTTTAATLDTLEQAGHDVYRAPKAYREGKRKNPSAPIRKRMYEAVKTTTATGQAWNTLELSNRLNVTLKEADTALDALMRDGLVHQAGADLFGPVWQAGAPHKGLFDNPAKSPARRAARKAAAWYQDETLATEPREIRIPDHLGFVEIGRIVAIEYESKKYDGTKRIWRHDVTGKRELHVSEDGSVFVVRPGFKITKRGIEG